MKLKQFELIRLKDILFNAFILKIIKWSVGKNTEYS